MHNSWKLRLIDVNFHNHLMGSILTVGEDISESEACYLLQCGNAVPVNDKNKTINVGGINEEKLHTNPDTAGNNSSISS